jgi:hypothetical protein
MTTRYSTLATDKTESITLSHCPVPGSLKTDGEKVLGWRQSTFRLNYVPRRHLRVQPLCHICGRQHRGFVVYSMIDFP